MGDLPLEEITTSSGVTLTLTLTPGDTRGHRERSGTSVLASTAETGTVGERNGAVMWMRV